MSHWSTDAIYDEAITDAIIYVSKVIGLSTKDPAFDKCVDENYCQKHLTNLKDGDVRKIGSKNFPFYYGDYNHKPAPEDKLWVENMEKIFPNIYFQGDKILDLDKYDIHGYELIK